MSFGVAPEVYIIARQSYQVNVTSGYRCTLHLRISVATARRRSPGESPARNDTLLLWKSCFPPLLGSADFYGTHRRRVFFRKSALYAILRHRCTLARHLTHLKLAIK